MIDPNMMDNNVDDGLPVNANGMFNGNRDGNDDGNDEDVDEYFDDAGDIGYLPADHVSHSKFNFIINFTFKNYL